jgi:anti-anti-sigma factor
MTPTANEYRTRLAPDLRENRPTLLADVEQALASGADRVLLDLTDTVYADSRALGVLVQVSHRCRNAEVPLVLVNLGGDLLTLFNLTKLVTLFTLVDEPAVAVVR